MSEFRPDQEKYEQMRAPFQSTEEAAAAVGEFYKGVKELREKHRIAEMVVLAGVYTEPKLHISSFTFGDLACHFQMLDRARDSCALDLARALTGNEDTTAPGNAPEAPKNK